MVDTSVWIDHLRNEAGLPHVRRLRSAFGQEPIVVGDLILLEILQGAPDEPRARKIEQLLRAFHIEPMMSDGLAVTAARNFRRLRSEGITVRKTIDLIIPTFCIERGYALLHDDRDFAHIARHLGLRQVPIEGRTPTG